jgi:hypothetical protein
MTKEGIVKDSATSFCLHPCSAPRLNQLIRAIEIEAAGPAFLLAGITLSHLEEEPFCRAAARTVKITLATFVSSMPSCWRW